MPDDKSYIWCGLRWWAYYYFVIGIEAFLCVSIHTVGMVSSCFDCLNLALVFCLIPLHLIIYRNIIGHFSLIRFQFLLYCHIIS